MSRNWYNNFNRYNKFNKDKSNIINKLKILRRIDKNKIHKHLRINLH